jgi:hypothetical protein
LQQTKTTDYTETSPGSGTFTFVTAPLTGDVVKVSYQFSTGASGNADTVDGIHASATPTANQLVALDSNALVPNAALGGAWSNWSPTLTGFSANPTNSVYRYIQYGKTVFIAINQGTNGTSNAATFTISLPVTAATITNMQWVSVTAQSVDKMILVIRKRQTPV